MPYYSPWILTFESPFAELVAEISRHFQVLVSYLSESVIKKILCREGYGEYLYEFCRSYYPN
jgi:hypothetical protein